MTCCLSLEEKVLAICIPLNRKAGTLGLRRDLEIVSLRSAMNHDSNSVSIKELRRLAQERNLLSIRRIHRCEIVRRIVGRDVARLGQFLAIGLGVDVQKEDVEVVVHAEFLGGLGGEADFLAAR